MQTKVSIAPSKRLSNLPKYIFTELEEWKAQAVANGADLINLGIGNPDGPTPEPILAAAVASMQNPVNHGYPDFRGNLNFRQAVSSWMKRKHDVDIDPETETIALLGGKEGLAHIAFAFTDSGDINIVPATYYPVHSRGTWLCGGDVYHVELEEKNNFLPDLSTIPEDVARRAKVFFVNYPNNPTAAVATREFYEELVAYCTKYNILICSDLAYGGICYDGYKPPSILEIPGAKDIAIEIHTFSKTFNMAGWRVGFAVGGAENIANFYALKSNMDYGTSSIIQEAAIAALNMDDSHVDAIIAKYQKRRDFMVDGLRKLGWDIEKPKATMYLWLKVPEGRSSKEWCKYILDTYGILLTPGIAFGTHNDGYFRLSLVAPDEVLRKALDRLEKAGVRFTE